MKILLITPPMTQVNTPYPATAYLSACLRHSGYEVNQADLGLELILKLFSKSGLGEIRAACLKNQTTTRSESVGFFLEAFSDYEGSIESVIRFLQGSDLSLALRIVNHSLLPEGPRFQHLHEHGEHLSQLFGEMGLHDKAKYLASLYLDDLADVLKAGVDARFEFSRYGEMLASSQNSFSPLYESLQLHTLIDKKMLELLDAKITSCSPEVIGFSTPFPGNVYAALKMGQAIKSRYPHIKTVMGGGFVNTELRGLSDPRFFEFIDYLTFDDGEKPLLNLLEMFQGKRKIETLLRTKLLKNGAVVDISDESEKDLSFKTAPEPDYSGLDLKRYISMLELPNPMHRMWSGFTWNKMILAHGCYWKKCSFCDVNLDYIGRFEPQKAGQLVDQIESLMVKTGSSGFHFVDEAAPPALLRALSEEIIKRNLKISWWGNLRFDKQFDKTLVAKMADAGCVAVTGGLEVANERLLKLMEKGVTIEQVTQVTKTFKSHGIFVHAYLMYAFPTQTVQETIDSLEVVRHLFLQGCLDSAHWHRFLATVHSPIGKNPQKYGITLQPPDIPAEGLFARYAVPFSDPVSNSTDIEMLGAGLRRALYNYMHGLGLKEDVRHWFERPVPKPTLS